MKKLLLFLLLFIPCMLFAETCNFEGISIEAITIEQVHGEASEKSSPVIDGMNISLDLKMTEVGDFIKYKITIKNETSDDYELSKKNLTTKSDFISYTFDNNGDNKISAGQTKEIYLIVKYNKKVTSFDNGVFNENKSVKTSLNLEELINPPTEDTTLFIYVALFIFCLTYLISSKKVRAGYNVFMATLLLIIPIKIYSLCTCEINVTSNIEIEEYSGRDLYNAVVEDSKLDSVSSKYVTSESGIDFKLPSSDTNGKGLYIFTSTKDDEYPIYYYRGAVNDNNVLFGGFCWKILRTTSNGGTKLVYAGVPDSEGKCNNTGVDTVVSTKVKYSATGYLGYFGYAYEAGHQLKNIKITAIPNDAVFSEDVTYEDGKYILSSNRYIKDANLGTTVTDSLHDHHYSCFKVDGEDCTTVNYVYMHRGGYLYYIILSDGEKIEDALKDVTDSNNTTDSGMKTYLENWYSSNLTGYNDYIDDEVYCNDRSIGDAGAWDKNGSLDDKISFGGLSRSMAGTPSITCSNPKDRFTTSTENGNGKNNYPIGLITLDEALLAGFAWDYDDESTYLYNGLVWWTMSPTLVSVQLNYIGVLHSMADNVTTVYVTGDAGGVRPVITLKNTVKIDSGDGTGDNPFTIVMN